MNTQASTLEYTDAEEFDGASVDLVALHGLDDMPLVMSPRTLSEQVEVSVTTLQRWRKTWPAGDRLGPAFFEPIGANMIRYARKDVVAWLSSARDGVAVWTEAGGKS